MFGYKKLLMNVTKMNKHGLSVTTFVCAIVPCMGNIWWGKFWQTMQVKAIGKENLANKLQSVHMPYTSSLYL